MLFELLNFTDGQFPAGLGWHDKIVEGFPVSSIESLSLNLGYTPADIAEFVGMDQSLMENAGEAALLSSSVSDKLFQLARAYQRLMVPLKDEAQARAWLRTPQPFLDNQVPMVALMTLAGAQEVLVLIEAIKPVKGVEMNPIFEAVRDDEVPREDRDSQDEFQSEDYPAEIM